MPGLIWKYKNRILYLVSYTCPIKCPYCFRKNLYVKNSKPAKPEQVVEFVSKHTQIREFIFSGGEPLAKPETIYKITKNLNLLPHIKMIRIHSRLPLVLPKKVNMSAMKRILDTSHKPQYLVLHVNHPEEIAKTETRKTLTALRRMGYILLSHTVFLKGINDSEKTLGELYTDLIELGIKPYSIFHCDNMEHTQKYIVPLTKEIKIMSNLTKTLSGIALPKHIIDSASGNGKIPVPTNFWKFDYKTYTDFRKKSNIVK